MVTMLGRALEAATTHSCSERYTAKEWLGLAKTGTASKEKGNGTVVVTLTGTGR